MRGIVMDWNSYYVINRYQKVCIRVGSLSVLVRTGNSILGTTLFIIFVDDLLRWNLSPFCVVSSNADDTNVLIETWST